MNTSNTNIETKEIYETREIYETFSHSNATLNFEVKYYGNMLTISAIDKITFEEWNFAADINDKSTIISNSNILTTEKISFETLFNMICGKGNAHVKFPDNIANNLTIIIESDIKELCAEIQLKFVKNNDKMSSLEKHIDFLANENDDLRNEIDFLKKEIDDICEKNTGTKKQLEEEIRCLTCNNNHLNATLQRERKSWKKTLNRIIYGS